MPGVFDPTVFDPTVFDTAGSTAVATRGRVGPRPSQRPGLGALGINWEHPLARGLVRCYVYSLSEGLPADLVSGAHRGSAFGSLVNTRRAERYPCGPGLRWGASAGVNDYVSYPAHAHWTIGAGQDFTLAIALASTMTGAASNWPQIISQDNLSGSRRGFAIDLWNQTSIGLLEVFTTGGAGSVAIPRTFVDGLPHLLVAGRRNASATGVLYASVDGCAAGLGTTGSLDLANGGNACNMGRFPDSADALADVQNTTVGLFAFWKGRGFTDAELATFPLELPALLTVPPPFTRRVWAANLPTSAVVRREPLPLAVGAVPTTPVTLPLAWSGMLPSWRGPRVLGSRVQRQEPGRLGINWRHRFARGLVRAYVYGMDGLPVDLVSGRHRGTAAGALLDHTVGRRADPWPAGPGLRWGAGTTIADNVSYAASADLAITNSEDFTVLVAMLSTYTPSVGNYGMLLDSQSGGSPRGFQIGLSNNGSVNGYLNVLSNLHSDTLNFTKSVVDGKPHLIIGGRRSGHTPYVTVDGGNLVQVVGANTGTLENAGLTVHHGTCTAGQGPTSIHSIQNTTIAAFLFWKGRGFTDKELAEFTPQALADLLSGDVLEVLPVVLDAPPVPTYPVSRALLAPYEWTLPAQFRHALPIGYLGMLPWLRGLRVAAPRQQPTDGSALEPDGGHDLARGLALGFVYTRLRQAQAGLAAPVAHDVVGRYLDPGGQRVLMAFFDDNGNGNTLGSLAMDGSPLAREGMTWGPSTTISNYGSTVYSGLPTWAFADGEDFTVAILMRSTDPGGAGRAPALLRSRHNVGGGASLRGWELLLHADPEARWSFGAVEGAGGAGVSVLGLNDVADGRTHLLIAGRRHGREVFTNEDGRPGNVGTLAGPLNTAMPLWHGRGETVSFTAYRLASTAIAAVLLWKGRGLSDAECTLLWTDPWRPLHVHEERHGIYIAPTIKVVSALALPEEHQTTPYVVRGLVLDYGEAPGRAVIPLAYGEAPGVQRVPFSFAGSVQGRVPAPFEASGRNPLALAFTWNEHTLVRSGLPFSWNEYPAAPLVGGALTFTWLERESLERFALTFTWTEVPAALPTLYDDDITFPHGEGRTTP